MRTSGTVLVAVLVAATLVEAGPVGAAEGGQILPTVVDVRTLSHVPIVKKPETAVRRSTLPVRPGTGTKSLPATASTGKEGVNGVTGRARVLESPNIVALNIESTSEGEAGFVPPADVNAAAGPTQVAETTNVYFKVRDKFDGAELCSASLYPFLRVTEPLENLSDPRIVWDSFADRFIMVVSPIDGIVDTPHLYVAASRTEDACGQWNVYNVLFADAGLPAGTILDFPNLGQDRDALLISTDNFEIIPATRRIAPVVFSIPKRPVYTGADISVPTMFAVGSTTSLPAAPAVVGGQPIPGTDAAYFLVGQPGFGYRLYRMTDTAGTPSVSLFRIVNVPYAAPSRQVNQCGTGNTITPGDGRITGPVVQIDDSIWFTHGVDLSGFPSVQYGVIRISDGALFSNYAFRTGSSDDFNPSIGVSAAGSNLFNIFVNWAYTDTRAVPCENVSVIVDGVRPGQGTPPLVGGSTVLATGQASFDQRGFGDYSSVVMDPIRADGSCTPDSTFVLGQQYFGPSSQWRTRLARFCFT